MMRSCVCMDYRHPFDLEDHSCGNPGSYWKREEASLSLEAALSLTVCLLLLTCFTAILAGLKAENQLHNAARRAASELELVHVAESHRGPYAQTRKRIQRGGFLSGLLKQKFNTETALSRSKFWYLKNNNPLLRTAPFEKVEIKIRERENCGNMLSMRYSIRIMGQEWQRQANFPLADYRGFKTGSLKEQKKEEPKKNSPWADDNFKRGRYYVKRSREQSGMDSVRSIDLCKPHYTEAVHMREELNASLHKAREGRLHIVIPENTPGTQLNSFTDWVDEQNRLGYHVSWEMLDHSPAGTAEEAESHE